MPLLDDIADYLSSGSIGTVGTDLFKGVLPDLPDAATVVYPSGGLEPVYTMGPSLTAPVVTRPDVQVVCRAAALDYESAMSKSVAVFRLLDALYERTINGVKYKYVTAKQSQPFPMGRDEAGRVLIACNYRVIREST